MAPALSFKAFRRPGLRSELSKSRRDGWEKSLETPFSPFNGRR